MRHIVPISGKDSAAVAVLLKETQPDLPVEYIFNPTRLELPPIFDWLRNTMSPYLGKPILELGDDLYQIIQEYDMIPSAYRRFCTRRAKIEPMEQYIGSEPCTMYFGIRADERRVGYLPVNKRINITPIYPLQDMAISLPLVYRILIDRGLVPPVFFWQRLYDECKVGIAGDIIDSLPVWEQHILFSWRSRANCYLCFFQRQYEWVGLLEHYPKLFLTAEHIEQTTGATLTKPFYWIKGKPLSYIRDNATRIFHERRQQVNSALIAKKYHNKPILGDSTQLDAVSCGLFCGK